MYDLQLQFATLPYTRNQLMPPFGNLTQLRLSCDCQHLVLHTWYKAQVTGRHSVSRNVACNQGKKRVGKIKKKYVFVSAPTVLNNDTNSLTSSAKKSLFLPRKSMTVFTNSSGSCLCSVNREFRTGSCGDFFAASSTEFPTVDALFDDEGRSTDSSSSDKIAIGVYTASVADF